MQRDDFSLSRTHYRVRATPALCIHICSEAFTKSSSLLPVPGKSLHLSARQSLFDQPETGCLTINTSLPAARCNLHYFPGLISFVFHPQVLSITKQHCRLGQFTLLEPIRQAFSPCESFHIFFFHLQKGTRAEENNLLLGNFLFAFVPRCGLGTSVCRLVEISAVRSGSQTHTWETDLPTLCWDLEHLFWGTEKKGGEEQMIPTYDTPMLPCCSPK